MCLKVVSSDVPSQVASKICKEGALFRISKQSWRVGNADGEGMPVFGTKWTLVRFGMSPEPIILKLPCRNKDLSFGERERSKRTEQSVVEQHSSCRCRSICILEIVTSNHLELGKS